MHHLKKKVQIVAQIMLPTAIGNPMLTVYTIFAIITTICIWQALSYVYVNFVGC